VSQGKYVDAIVKEQLKQYVHPNQVFGPVDSSVVKEPRCAAALFDWQNYAFAEMLEGSDILVGRRGAGKSSLIRSFGTRKYLIGDFQSEGGREFRTKFRLKQSALTKLPDLVIDFNTPKEVNILEIDVARQRILPPVDVMAEVWIRRIWREIGRELANSDSFSSLIPDQLRRYASNADMQDFYSESPFSVEDYESQLSDLLIENSLNVVVTFDNMEEHRFVETQNAVLAGLIAAVGRFMGAQHRSVDVKLCLPAELFQRMKEITFRPDKDLAKIQYLHWNPAELLHLAMRRLLVYFEAWEHQELEFVHDAQFSDRKALRSFWHRYLPEKITNGLGVREDTLNYILRHTQLLPRQLVSILNSIIARSRKAGSDPFSEPFSELDVVKGVEDSEEPSLLASCKMFEPLYPDLRNILNAVLPRMQRESTYGELQSIWNSSGKKYMYGNDSASYRAFLQLMFAVGVLGVKVIDECTATYSVARFAFNTKYALQVSDKDILCVHPMYSRVFNLMKSGSALVVLPRGSDFDFERRKI
jgi:hypothetical protein